MGFYWHTMKRDWGKEKPAGDVVSSGKVTC